MKRAWSSPSYDPLLGRSSRLAATASRRLTASARPEDPGRRRRHQPGAAARGARAAGLAVRRALDLDAGRGHRSRAADRGAGAGRADDRAGLAGAARVLAGRRAAERPDGRGVAARGQPRRRQPRGRARAGVHRDRADPEVLPRHGRVPGRRGVRRGADGAGLDGAAVPWWAPFTVPAGAVLAIGAIGGPGLRATWPCAAASTCRRTWAARRRSRWAGSAATAGAPCRQATCCARAPRRRPATPRRDRRRPAARARPRLGDRGHRGAARGTGVLHPGRHRRAVRQQLHRAPQLGAHRRPAHRAAPVVGPRGRRRGRAAPVQHPRRPLRGRRARLHRGHADHPRPGRAEPRRVRLPGRHRERRAVEDGAAAAGGHGALRAGARGGRGVACATGARSRRWRAPAATATTASWPGARRATDAPAVVYRRDGDDNVIVEYGDPVLDLGLRMRVHALQEALAAEGLGRGHRPHARHPVAAGPHRRRAAAREVAAAAAAAGRGRRCPRRTSCGCRRAPCGCRCPGTTRRPGSPSSGTCTASAPTRRGRRGTSSSSGGSTGWRRRGRARDRLRRAVPGARARRRVPGRAGGHAGRPAAPAGDDQVQPGADVDGGELRRHRRRVPVHLRHGGARRLPVRRADDPGVEPVPPRRAVRGAAVGAALLRPDRVVPGQRRGTARPARRDRGRAGARGRDRRLVRLRLVHAVPGGERGVASRRSASRQSAAFAAEKERWRASGEFDRAEPPSRARAGAGADSRRRSGAVPVRRGPPG